MALDKTDFLILKLLHDTDKPLWKNKVHEQQPDILQDPVSVQTIGRRMEQLQDDGYLESCITSPDEINRDLIIAFKLTEDGKEALENKRQEILLAEVERDLFHCTPTEPGLKHREIVELVSDEFNLDDTSRGQLETYDREELVTFLLLYFIRDDSDKFVGQLPDTAPELAENCPELSPPFNTPIQDIFSL